MICQRVAQAWAGDGVGVFVEGGRYSTVIEAACRRSDLAAEKTPPMAAKPRPVPKAFTVRLGRTSSRSR